MSRKSETHCGVGINGDSMEKVDICIIGAGIIGLAIAQRLSALKRDIVVLERHDGFGRETSSRNSEVIHAGMYYPTDSLKARLCVEGNRMLYDLCEKKAIPYRRIGKIIVAENMQELDKIELLYRQGVANGVCGLRIIEEKEILAMEPKVTARRGLFSPDTGIVDTHKLMHYLEREAEAHGVIVAYSCPVSAITKLTNGYCVAAHDADGEEITVHAGCVINAAGLGCDTLAASAGIDIDSAGYRLHPCKGEYFSLSNRHRGTINHLVYPAPTPISLGIHVVVNLEGGLKLGPNAFYVDFLDYDVNSSHRQEFFISARRFFPGIEFDDLAPDMAGIRPKLQRADGPWRDFIISEESEKGYPGLINLIGIESPGLTSCLSIAEMVEHLVREL